MQDFRFLELEGPVEHALKRKRTVDIQRTIARLLYPVWEAYINYYLYKNGIYDNNPDKDDFFNEVYVKCVEAIPGIMQTDYNLVKRYYNKSIEGWIKHKVFDNKKKKVTLVKDDVVMLLTPDTNYDHAEAEHKEDMRRVSLHLRKQGLIFQELYAAVFPGTGSRSRQACKQALNVFKGHIMERYAQQGCLVTAEAYLTRRIGGVFNGSHI